jgi:dTDP-L-rhamnose 4-epimerase
MKILVTGGAGFIGSHLVDDLLKKDHDIVVYDNLEPQVHGIISKPPSYLAKNITFLKADIRDRKTLSNAIEDVDVIYHLAASVGVVQSMYQVEKFVDVNTLGTAKLLDILVNDSHNVKKLIVASSMSTYGEGAYNCSSCGNVVPNERPLKINKEDNWDILCPSCSKNLGPIATPEDKSQDCTTIYALTKKEQEKMCMLIGKTYGINTTALRFFGTYGSRQALSNPYTGVCAIFSSAYLSKKQPLIYEDGLQSRDLIHVKDICQALTLSMEKKEATNEIFNVGTGHPVTINQVAKILQQSIGSTVNPQITYKYRAGDVRHIYADISKISSKLGFKPKISFEQGIGELIEWIKKTTPQNLGNSDIANEELKKKNLI